MLSQDKTKHIKVPRYHSRTVIHFTCNICRSVGATVVEMLTGKRPFHEYKEKMAIIFALGLRKLSLERLICGPGFSDEVQEFLRLCINW